MKVFLVGFSGSGKSTIGPKLAKLIGCPYIDTDSEIERRANTTIPEIFAEKGEAQFRELESSTIEKITCNRTMAAVVGLGGGAFVALHNRRTIAKSGVVVYLRCELHELYRRLSKHRDRPLLFGRSGSRKDILTQMRSLLQKRKRYYEMADIIVSTTRLTPHQVAAKIKRQLKEYGY